MRTTTTSTSPCFQRKRCIWKLNEEKKIHNCKFSLWQFSFIRKIRCFWWTTKIAITIGFATNLFTFFTTSCHNVGRWEISKFSVNPKKVWRWGLIKKFHATFQRLSTSSDNLLSEHLQIASQTMPLFRSVSRCRPRTPSAPCTTSCPGKPCRCNQSPKTCSTRNCCCKRSRPRPNCSNKGCCCKKSEQKKVTCVNKSCEQPAPCPTSCCSVSTKTCPDRSRSRCPKAKCPSTCSETVRQTCSPSPCAPKSSSKASSCVRSGCTRRKPCMACCQSGSNSRCQSSSCTQCPPSRSTSQCQSPPPLIPSQCQSSCGSQCQPKLVIRCLDEAGENGDCQKPKKRWSFSGKKWVPGTLHHTNSLDSCPGM